MTIFSLFLVILSIFAYIQIKNKKCFFLFLLAMSISLEMMIDVGYFIKIGSFELGYGEVGYIALTIYTICNYLPYVLNKKNWPGLLLFMLVCGSLLLEFIFPYGKPVIKDSNGWDRYFYLGEMPTEIIITFTHIKEIIHVICYVIIFIFAKSFNKIEDKVLFKYLSKFFSSFLLLGMIEVIFVKIFNQQSLLIDIEKVLFGNSYFSDDTLVSIGITGRLRGLKSEPSMYSYVLYIVSLFYLLTAKFTRKSQYKLLSIVSIAIMLFSLSFSTIFCFVFSILIYIGYKYKKSGHKGRLSITLLSIVVLITGIIFIKYVSSKTHFDNYYLERIRMALLSVKNINMSSWNDQYDVYDASTLIRLKSIVGSFEYFLDRPLFGLGLGSSYAHSTFFTVLASVGFIGTSSWIYFTFYSSGKHTVFYSYLVILRLIMISFVGSGLFPFYGLECILIFKMIDIFSSNEKIIEYMQ